MDEEMIQAVVLYGLLATGLLSIVYVNVKYGKRGKGGPKAPAST